MEAKDRVAYWYGKSWIALQGDPTYLAIALADLEAKVAMMKLEQGIAFDAGAAWAVGDHKDFQQIHPNKEEWIAGKRFKQNEVNKGFVYPMLVINYNPHTLAKERKETLDGHDKP